MGVSKSRPETLTIFFFFPSTMICKLRNKNQDLHEKRLTLGMVLFSAISLSHCLSQTKPKKQIAYEAFSGSGVF